jgi:hypothetical protein
MEIGDVYIRKHIEAFAMKELKFRYVQILSITETHVYVKQLMTGFTSNIPIEEFNRKYTAAINSQEKQTP